LTLADAKCETDATFLESAMPSSPRLDVLAFGNAIVDVIAQADDAFLAREAIHKGAMNLIDEARAEHLYAAMGPATIVSGGSAANTAAGLASFGARAGFVGKVRSDELGRLFAHDVRAAGVEFASSPASDGPATARSFIFVTPDGERTMNTYLGACQNLTVADVDPDQVRAAGLVYLEGYLWDPPAAKDAFVKAARIAHEADRRVALTLSDSFCVDRYRDEFLTLIRDGLVDVVFANESELRSLYQTADIDAALRALGEEAARDPRFLGVCTRSEKGSIVVSRESVVEAGAFPIAALVDTTGAGDLFAAGFLAGLARGADHRLCAHLGALAAAEVIQHLGARPQAGLADLAAQEGLL
jgi:sugar/nucleoside kinase (ribokinase family)